MKRIIDNQEVEVRRLPDILTMFAVAMTINKKIYHINPTFSSERTLRHELCHMKQQENLGFWKFLWLYYWNWLKLAIKGKRAYKNNPFELEAKEWQYTPKGWENVTKDSWRGYV